MMTSPATVSPFSGSSACSIPHLSHIKIIRNVMAAGKFTDTFAVLRRLNVLIRHEMIQHKRDLVLAKTPSTFILSISWIATGDVISFPRTRSRSASMSCPAQTDEVRHVPQDLLCHCHTHILSPPTIKLYFRVCVIFIWFVTILS